MSADNDDKNAESLLGPNRSRSALNQVSSNPISPQNFIKCRIKNCEIKDDKLLEIHHLVPKCVGGIDKDGRVRLCKKHHEMLQNYVPKIIFDFLKNEEQKQKIRQEIKRVSLTWMDKETQSHFNLGK